MKRISLALVLCIVGSMLYSQSIKKTYYFQKPVVAEWEDGYTLLHYPESRNYAPEGYPELPHKGITLVLPQLKEIQNIKITNINYYDDVANMIIKPAGKQFPLSQIDEEYEIKAIPGVYTSTEKYPLQQIEDIRTQFLSGHSIACFTLCPVEYIPAKNEVKFIESISVEIELTTSSAAIESQKFLNNNPRVYNRIKNNIKDYSEINNYKYNANRAVNDVDILLISNAALLPEFDAFVYYKKSTGYIVETITTEDIYTNFTGNDQQDKIRNCIIDYVTNNNLQYVILGGDADANNASNNIIPDRGFYGNAYNTPDEDIPADIYYSNLDGNWNNDNDNKYGEPGEEDLYSEVSIGRICVDNIAEITNAVNKNILYQDAPVIADIEKSLFLGELLWSDPTWAGDYKDEVAFGASTHGYSTVGPTSNISITFLYERNMSWDKYDVFNEYNNEGLTLRNHLGHSDVTYNMLMYTSDLTTANFTNDGITRGFGIGYSQGCYNGSMDNREAYGSYSEDCFSERFTTMETGEVANVGNSRYGWGQHSSTDGASQYFDRQFFDAIFGEDITMIGDANQDSKEDNTAYIDSHEGAIRWCYYEINLFGDPTLDIWTATPTPIVATYPAAISIGVSQLMIQTDAPGARIGIMQDSVLIGRGIAGNDGNLTLNLFDPVSSEEAIQISIIAHNRERHLGSLIVITNEPYVTYENHSINDSCYNNNGLLEYGEQVFVNVTLKNVGMVEATDINVNLSSGDSYISLQDTTEFYGSLNPGESKTIKNAFCFTAAGNIPDMHLIDFKLEANAQNVWLSYFNENARGPSLTVDELIVDDSQGGNNDGILDPGETAILKIKNRNTGHCIAPDCIGEIYSPCQYLEFMNDFDSLGSIGTIGSRYAEFTVVVDSDAPNGVIIANLYYTISSNEYACDKVFKRKLGLLVEDFETGDFSKFDWQFSGDQPWNINDLYPFEGLYDAISGNVNHGESSELLINLETMAADSISFIKKVSSEADCDKLKFFIDNTLKAEWSGTTTGWTKEVFYVPAGNHSFKWVYTKDGGGSSGSDKAWVDYIILPPVITLTCHAGADASICSDEIYQCLGNATAYDSVLWSTNGTGTFSNSLILTPEYTPSQDDINSGSLMLILNAYGEGASTDDEMILSFMFEPSQLSKPSGPEYVDLFSVQSTDYTTESVINATSYKWHLEPLEAGTLIPDNTSVTVNWNSSYTGNVSLKVNAVNDCGEGELSEALQIIVDNTVGIEDLYNPELKIYPNPAKDIINISLNEKLKINSLVKIFDCYGKLLIEKSIETGLNKLSINIKMLDLGMYYFQYSDQNQCFTKKFIKTK